MGEMMVAKFNDGQRSVFDQVMASTNDVDNILPRFIFWMIQQHHRSPRPRKKCHCCCFDWNRLNLTDWRCHLSFKLYPPMTETTRSKIEAGSYAAQLIRRADIIISDKATMKLNLALDAVNELLQTTMKSNYYTVAKFSFLAAILDSACPL